MKKLQGSGSRQVEERQVPPCTLVMHSRSSSPLSDAQNARNKPNKFQNTFCALRIPGVLPPANCNKLEQQRKTHSSYKCIRGDEKRIDHSEKSLLTVETCIFTWKMHSTLMKSQTKIENFENAPFTNRKPVKNANGLSSNLSVSWPGKFWFTTTFSSRTN